MNKIDVYVDVAALQIFVEAIPFGDLHDTLNDGFSLDRIELHLDSVNTDSGMQTISMGLYADKATATTMDGLIGGACFDFLETMVGVGNYSSNVIVMDFFSPLLLVNGACYVGVVGTVPVNALVRFWGSYVKPDQSLLALSAFNVALYPEVKV